MSFPRYSNYKDSGVEWLGAVPEHWEVKRLKYNLRLLTDKTERRHHPVALENIEGFESQNFKDLPVSSLTRKIFAASQK